MNTPIPVHPGQVQVWRDQARHKVIAAGRRWGKSILGAEAMLATTDKPKSNTCYVGPTRQQAKEIIWDYLKQRCFQNKWRVKINESELKIIRSNKSTLEVKSAEREDRFRGRKFDLIVLDEYAEYKGRTIWSQAIRPTLSDTRGRAMFLFTPKGYGLGYDLFQRAKTEDGWACYTFRTIDSPFFQTEEGKREIEEARSNLSELDFKQEYEAEFVAHAGRICYAFDRLKHSTDLDYNPQLPVIIGMDFNVAPSCSAIFQKTNEGLVQIGEIFLKSADTRQTCEIIQQRFFGSRLEIRPDATGRNRSSAMGISDFDILRQFKFNIQCDKINPKRVDRYASVNRAFEKGWLKINLKNCPQTVKDLETLIYKEGTSDPQLTDPMAGHMFDAFGYAIHREYPIVKPRKVSVASYL